MLKNKAPRVRTVGMVGSVAVAATLFLGGNTVIPPRPGNAVVQQERTANVSTTTEPGTTAPLPVGIESYGNAEAVSSAKVHSICETGNNECSQVFTSKPQPAGEYTTPVKTSEVLGAAYITSISVSKEYSACAYCTLANLGAPIPGAQGATVQLNSELLVKNGNTDYFYWVQNFAVLNTANKSISFDSNVWPDGRNAISFVDGQFNIKANAKVINYEFQNMAGGNGYAVPTKYSSVVGWPYYIYSTQNLPYSLPLSAELSEKIVNGTMYFGYQLDGSARVTYDQLKITIPHSDMEFFTPGSMSTPESDFGHKPVNLVFGGSPGSESATFSSLNANIYIYYLSKQGIKPYTEAESADFNTTGETVTNLQSADSKSGSVHVGIGDPDKAVWDNYASNQPSLSSLLRSG